MNHISRLGVPAVLITTLGVVACSGSKEDVRLTLCKDMATILAEAPSGAVWKHSEHTGKRHEDLVMKIWTEGTGGSDSIRAECHYAFDSDAEEYNMSANPLAVYSSNPHMMTLNGEPVLKQVLHDTIQAAMLKQGKEFVEKVKKGVEGAGEKIKDTLEGER